MPALTSVAPSVRLGDFLRRRLRDHGGFHSACRDASRARVCSGAAGHGPQLHAKESNMI
jgi:hypothetical protein